MANVEERKLKANDTRGGVKRQHNDCTPSVPVHKICRALSRAVSDVSIIIISTRPSVNDGGGGNERKNKSSSPSSTHRRQPRFSRGLGGRTSKTSSKGHRHRKSRYKRARLATWVM